MCYAVSLSTFAQVVSKAIAAWDLCGKGELLWGTSAVGSVTAGGVQVFSMGFPNAKEHGGSVQKNEVLWYSMTPCPEYRNKARRLISGIVARPFWILTFQVAE